jgi:Tol biopolymer transport system component
VAPAASGAGSTFTIADLIDVKHPSSPVWSPDGSRVVFVWDRAGVSNLYVSDLSSAPRPLTTETGAGVTSTPFWSNDGARVFFAHRGDLWQVPAAGGAPVTVWITPAVESDITCAPDGMRVAFARRSDTGTELVVRTLDGGAETVVARDAQAIGGLSWSPDGRRIAFSAGARSIRHEQIPDYSGAKIV